MKIAFDINVILYIAAINIGIFSSLLLLFSTKNKTANRLLALLMLAITGWIVDAFFRASGISPRNWSSTVTSLPFPGKPLLTARYMA